jgi:hypothetical protein
VEVIITLIGISDQILATVLTISPLSLVAPYLVQRQATDVIATDLLHLPPLIGRRLFIPKRLDIPNPRPMVTRDQVMLLLPRTHHQLIILPILDILRGRVMCLLLTPLNPIILPKLDILHGRVMCLLLTPLSPLILPKLDTLHNLIILPKLDILRRRVMRLLLTPLNQIILPKLDTLHNVIILLNLDILRKLDTPHNLIILHKQDIRRILGVLPKKDTLHNQVFHHSLDIHRGPALPQVITIPE